MIQINISEIKNGFLVATPPGRVESIQAAQNGVQPQPCVQFCDNFEAVVMTLKSVWPKDIVGS